MALHVNEAFSRRKPRNHFALDVFLGAAHNNAHLVGLGHSESVTASAAEPTTLVIVAAGLLAAHALGRRRRFV